MENQKIVYISPSLQEWNVGVGNYGTEEERMNQIADVVERQLKAMGYDVRRNNPENTLAQTVRESNQIGPAVHVAIHSNASGPSTQGKGPEIYANRPNTSGDKLAQLIYNEIEKIYTNPEKGRGVIYTTSLYEVVKTLSPAVLLEVAFHDNEEDAKWIINNIENIGKAIAIGINNYFQT